MPAKSEKQRRAAGAALSAKKSGDTSNLQGSGKGMAKTMTIQELRDFAKKPKGGSK